MPTMRATIGRKMLAVEILLVTCVNTEVTTLSMKTNSQTGTWRKFSNTWPISSDNPDSWRTKNSEQSKLTRNWKQKQCSTGRIVSRAYAAIREWS